MIVIVGHGPSMEGSGRGMWIDRHTVVRMHEWHLQHPESDYGTRCDYAVLPGPWVFTAIKDACKAPKIEWWMYQLRKRRSRVPTDVLRTPVVAMDVDAGLSAPAPTRGLAAVIMARSVFPDEQIILTGFDALRTGRMMPYPGWYRERYGPAKSRGTRSDRHDFEEERDLLKTIPGVEFYEDAAA